jgi:hypothetical protein
VLQGEGSGTDEIIVAIQKYSNVGSDSYGWNLNGYTAYRSGDAFLSQPGAIQLSQLNSAGYPSLPLWNSTIPYWFIVSGRRIIVITKISTTYQMAYLGFFLPFASPNQYPYPLAVGGSFFNSSGATQPRYSGATGTSSAFWTHVTSSISANALWTLLPGNFWMNYPTGQNSSTGYTGMFPYNQDDIGLIRNSVDDTPILTPIEMQFVTAHRR